MSMLCCARPDGVFGFAQVGERLKPTDCKSVPLRRYGGSNPPLCTRVAKEKVSKFQGCKVSNLAHLGSLKPWNFETLKHGICVTIKKKFVLALIAYAVLGVLAWTTLSDEPIRVFNANVRLRTGTLLILGLFAFRAALYFWRTRIEEERADAKPTD